LKHTITLTTYNINWYEHILDEKTSLKFTDLFKIQGGTIENDDLESLDVRITRISDAIEN
jgi:hypothetical protein